MRVAALDLGSNTFLCLIAEVESSGIGKVIDDQVRMVRLGQDVAKTGRFHPEALQRAELALSDFSKIIETHRPERILAMATSAARDAENKEELFALGEKYGIPIEIIPGGREAEITFSGSISGIQREAGTNFLVIDVGGGSTEYIVGQKGASPTGQSLNLGCVRLKEMSANNKDLGALRGKIREELNQLKINVPQTGFEVIAVAGTPTELARIQVGVFDPAKIDGFHFSVSDLDQWAEKLFVLSPEEITQKYGVNPGRADVLVHGVLILAESLKHFGAQRLTVSVRGVRYGVALDLFKR